MFASEDKTFWNGNVHSDPILFLGVWRVFSKAGCGIQRLTSRLNPKCVDMCVNGAIWHLLAKC